MRGEEAGIDATWILEYEAECGFRFAVDFGGGVDEAEELKHGPEDEAEEKRIANL